MMATAKKYLFDMSFDQVEGKPSAPVPVPVLEPQPEETFTRTEFEAARQAVLTGVRQAQLHQLTEGGKVPTRLHVPDIALPLGFDLSGIAHGHQSYCMAC